MRLEGKVALITGGGSGIGRETAVLFAAEGASVVVSDMKECDARKTTEIVEAAGGRSTFIGGNVTNGRDAYRMVHAAAESYGKLDVLVNSAGISPRSMDSGVSVEEVWDKVIQVNLKGTYLVSWEAVPEMKRAGGGSIINLGSIASLVGMPSDRNAGFDPYPPSKGGVLQFTRNLAVDLAKHEIRVNCVCPGHVYTSLTEPLTSDKDMLQSLVERYPMGRLGQPVEVAYTILFLASGESSYVTGASLAVDGGYTAQ